MKPETDTSPAECLGYAVPPDPQPRCPVCGGCFLPVRHSWRCCRCLFSLCDGCEGGEEYADLGDL
jgi:hypothetical protein